MDLLRMKAVWEESDAQVSNFISSRSPSLSSSFSLNRCQLIPHWLLRAQPETAPNHNGLNKEEEEWDPRLTLKEEDKKDDFLQPLYLPQFDPWATFKSLWFCPYWPCTLASVFFLNFLTNIISAAKAALVSLWIIVTYSPLLLGLCRSRI